MLKIKNSTPTSNGGQNPMQPHPRQSNGARSAPIHEHQPKYSNGHRLTPIQEQQQQQPRHSLGHLPINQQPQQQQQQQQQRSRHSTSGVVVTTKWETFDSAPALAPHPSTSTSSSAQPKFNWEFFEFE
jgi:hypothetical protein